MNATPETATTNLKTEAPRDHFEGTLNVLKLSFEETTHAIAQAESAVKRLRELRARRVGIERAMKALGLVNGKSNEAPTKRARRGLAEELILSATPKVGETLRLFDSIVDHAEALSRENKGPNRSTLRKAAQRLVDAGRLVRDAVSSEGAYYRLEADSDKDRAPSEQELEGVPR